MPSDLGSTKQIVAVIISTLIALAPAHSQYAAPEAPSFDTTAEEIRQALLPAPSETRGIGRDQPEASRPAQAPTATLNISFEQGTERLTVEGMRTLQALALALQDPQLQGVNLQIAAHGYAQGDPQLQVRTSRRAQTVSEHLAAFYNVDLYRLQPIGLGAQYVVNPSNSADPLNSRVEVINLSMR